MPDELRTFRVIPNAQGMAIEELTDSWQPVVSLPTPDMASDEEVAVAIASHAVLPDAHHPANVGITGTKTIGGFKFTFTNGLLTGFEPV